MSPDDAREVEELARSISELLALLGGSREILDFEVAHFRARLDGDDQGARLAISKVRALDDNLRAGDELLGTFSKALRTANLPLAYSIHEAAVSLVARSVVSADEEGPNRLLAEPEDRADTA